LAVGLLLERLADVRLTIPRYAEPYRLVNVVLLLKTPEPYAMPLELLVLCTSFQEPAGRAEALRRLAELVKPEDIADGFYDVGDDSWSPRRLARKALKQFHEQSELADVELVVLNARGRIAGRSQIPEQDSHAGVFLLGLSATVQGLSDFARAHDLKQELVGLLRAIAVPAPGEDSYLCLWFAPLGGASLSREQGEAMFDRVLASTI
jgi:hypothetical protein